MKTASPTPLKTAPIVMHLRLLKRTLTLTALFATLPLAGRATTLTTAPLGSITSSLPVGTTGLAFPLISADVYSGTIASNNGSTLTFSTGNVASTLTTGTAYYLEVLSGPLEGERLDLNTAESIAAGGATAKVSFSASGYSTVSGLPTNALIGARCTIRPHLTLARLQSQFSPGLSGNNNAGLADGVQLHGVSSGWVSYTLRADGATWRAVGKTTDERNRIIPPDTSITVILRSAGRKWVHAGLVRTTAFRKNLVAGTQSFSSGFPLALTPIQLAAFTDMADPIGIRWVGHAAGASDRLHLMGAGGSLTVHYLDADGTTWRTAAGATSSANQPIISATGATLVTRTNPDAAYLVVRPFPL